MSAAAAVGPGRPLGVIAERTFRARLRLPLYSGAALAATSLLAIGAFAGLDDGELFQSLPAAFERLIGGSGSGNYVVSEIFGLLAPVVVLIIAISGGVAAVAGEERDRTAGLLLAQPVARRDLVVAKAAVVALHVLLAIGLLALGFLLAAALFDSGVSTANALAATVHLLALGLAFAMVALAASAWTGSARLSLALAAGLAVAANLSAALLPLVDGLADGARLSPWYYYNGSQPLANGLDAGHLAVLLAIAACGLALALVGVRRRDIEPGRRGGTLTLGALDRLTRPRVDGVFAKAVSERVLVAAVAGGALASMAIAVSLMFDGLAGTLGDLGDAIPAALAGLYGAVDLGTPAGWISAELTSILLPGILIALAAVQGVAAIAGEERRHTLDLLLAAPIGRRRLLLSKAAALAVVTAAAGLVAGLGIVAGSLLGGLGLAVGGVAATIAHAVLLALFFGALALAIGAAASAQVATRVTVAAALLAYLAQAFLPSLPALADLAVLSPWHLYDSSMPLVNGVDALHLGALATLTAVALAAALWLVERRDVSR